MTKREALEKKERKFAIPFEGTRELVQIRPDFGFVFTAEKGKVRRFRRFLG